MDKLFGKKPPPQKKKTGFCFQTKMQKLSKEKLMAHGGTTGRKTL